LEAISKRDTIYQDSNNNQRVLNLQLKSLKLTASTQSSPKHISQGLTPGVNQEITTTGLLAGFKAKVSFREMEYVEDDRIPIENIIEKITPKDLVKSEEKKTVTFTPINYTPKPPDLRIRTFKKKLTF
jgi:hypothetical protein